MEKDSRNDLGTSEKSFAAKSRNQENTSTRNHFQNQRGRQVKAQGGTKSSLGVYCLHLGHSRRVGLSPVP